MDCGHQSFEANPALVAFLPQARYVAGSIPALIALWVFGATLPWTHCMKTFTVLGFTFGLGWFAQAAIALIGTFMVISVLANHNRASRVTLTARGLGIQTLTGHKDIPWEDISFTRYRDLSGMLMVTAKKKRQYALGRELSNFDKLRREIGYHSAFIKLDAIRRPDLFLEPPKPVEQCKALDV